MPRLEEQREFPIEAGKRLSASAVKRFVREALGGGAVADAPGLGRTALYGGTTLVGELATETQAGIAARNVMAEAIPQFSIVEITGTDATASNGPQVEVEAPTRAGLTASIAWCPAGIEAGGVGVVYTDGMWLVTVVAWCDEAGAWIDPDRTHMPPVATADPVAALTQWRMGQKLQPGAFCCVLKNEFAAWMPTTYEEGAPALLQSGNNLTIHGTPGPLVVRARLDHVGDLEVYKVAKRWVGSPWPFSAMCLVEKRETPFL